MPIDPSIEHGAFEPEATAAMGEAFEAACKELHDAGKPEVVRKHIAERIIAAARRGELDPVRLRTAALSWIIVTRMSPAVSHRGIIAPGLLGIISPKQPRQPQHPTGSPLMR
jgi:hypothetical protein